MAMDVTIDETPLTEWARRLIGMEEGGLAWWAAHAVGCGIPFARLYRTIDAGVQRIWEEGEPLPLIEQWIEWPPLDGIDYDGARVRIAAHIRRRIHPKLLMCPWQAGKGATRGGHPLSADTDRGRAGDGG